MDEKQKTRKFEKMTSPLLLQSTTAFDTRFPPVIHGNAFCKQESRFSTDPYCSERDNLHLTVDLLRLCL